MKICLYTDNHFSQYSSILRKRGNKYSLRLENQIESLNWVEKIAEEENCSSIICLGDFFDTPMLNAEELTALKDINFNKNIHHFFLVGNHEMGNNDLSYNSSYALSQYGTVINKPTIEIGFGYEILYLPYMLEDNRKSLQEIIEETTKEFYSGMITTQEVKERIILSHNDLKGIRYGQYESKQGFDIKEIDKCCSLFINGHLHNQQQITNKILNLGNITGQNFSEDGFKYSHCLAILDTNTLKVNLINNPYAINFYKIDTTKDNNFDIIDKCYNGVATIRVNKDKVEELKNRLKSSNLLEYRLIIDYPIKEINNNQPVLKPKLNHIDKFLNYISEKIEDSDILKEELSLLH